MVLTNDEKAAISKVLGNTATAFGLTVAKLLVAHPQGGPWQYQGQWGAVCVVLDRTKNAAKFIKMFDLQTNQLLFSNELYEHMNYARQNELFHSFETDQAIVGLSFADVDGAASFMAKVNQFIPRPVGDSSEGGGEGGDGKRTSFFSRLKGRLRGSSKSKKPQISGPTDVKQVGHIGFGADGVFDVSQIPPELKAVFKASGIRKKDLKDPQFAQTVNNIVQQMGGVPAAAPPGPTPPPGPMPPSGPAPPAYYQQQQQQQFQQQQQQQQQQGYGAPPPPPPVPTNNAPHPPMRGAPPRAPPAPPMRGAPPPAPPVPVRGAPPPAPPVPVRGAPPAPPMAPGVPGAPPAPPMVPGVPGAPPAPPAFGFAPPAPPPAPGAFAPPAAPPVPSGGASSGGSGGRGDLLAAIRAGKSLKKAAPAPASSPSSSGGGGGGRGDLLAAIRAGRKLKSVKREPANSRPAPQAAAPANSLMGALAAAMAARNKVINPSGPGSDDEDDDEWSD